MSLSDRDKEMLRRFNEKYGLPIEEVPIDELAGREAHDYLSTACHHGLCGDCRVTCKFCKAQCLHECHLPVAA